ncbi:secreted protein [Stachybotrys elegans]|uniref:Secreted protein n=1 Tax=Stachybotrys elegans TaxID=80388 RepID=A0A8K0WMA9_9HYPO|nr:secreted protein [Stachybotrys elegans]
MRSLSNIVLGLGLVSVGKVVPVVAQSEEIGVAAYPFPLGQVTLGEGRWADSQSRTLNYLLQVDVERLLYNFRLNHGLSTQGASTNGGWDAPTFPFRTHAQGHYLTAWSQCWAILRNEECRDRATYFSAELQKCQANNEAAGFNAGYLSGFPESDIQRVEDRTLNNGNVPYYALHKTLAGLLDVWRYTGDEVARDTLLEFCAWVDWRTGRLSYDQMQAMLRTEFGGMNEVLADVYHQTGDERWLEVAQRFDDAFIFDPLANDQDRLNGLHANTQIPKWIGSARTYKASGTTRYLDIARNAWQFTVNQHSYSIGSNSQAEHFRPPNQISGFLTNDTGESCNTYNMLKLTRELWLVDPRDTTYFDFYERAMLNHMIGIQHPSDEHGHITYFTPLNPGGHRGIGPAWGGGTWSTDYNSFWCCQATSLETFTKLADSIFFYDESTLYVNQFTASRLDWADREVVVTQDTAFPASNNSTLTIEGSGSFDLAVRIPAWTSDATITVNGEPADAEITPGEYAIVTRDWADGDVVEIVLPFSIYTIAANDDDALVTVAYGPVVLAGDYGDETLSSSPAIDLESITQQEGSLEFEAVVDGQARRLFPFYDAHDINYNVYWRLNG